MKNKIIQKYLILILSFKAFIKNYSKVVLFTSLSVFIVLASLGLTTKFNAVINDSTKNKNLTTSSKTGSNLNIDEVLHNRLLSIIKQTLQSNTQPVLTDVYQDQEFTFVTYVENGYTYVATIPKKEGGREARGVSSTGTAHVDTRNFNFNFTAYNWRTGWDVNGYGSDFGIRWYVDLPGVGTVRTYCIDATTQVDNGNYYSGGSMEGWDRLDFWTQKYIYGAMLYNMNVLGDSDAGAWATTQVIWEKTNDLRINSTSWNVEGEKNAIRDFATNYANGGMIPWYANQNYTIRAGQPETEIVDGSGASATGYIQLTGNSLPSGVYAHLYNGNLYLYAPANTPSGTYTVNIDLFGVGGKGLQDLHVFGGNGTIQDQVGTARYGDPMGTFTLNILAATGTAKITKQNLLGQAVPGTVFEWSPNADMSSSERYTTGSDGSFTTTGKLAGTYYYREASVPAPLIVDTTIRSITIVAGEDASNTVTNKDALGRVKIIKRDNPDSIGYKDVFVPNSTYKLENFDTGVVVETITTNASGEATSKDLPLGKYKAYETSTIAPYILDTKEYIIEIKYKDQTTEIVVETLNVTNTRAYGKIELFKKEAPTSPQYINKFLSNATYEVKSVATAQVVATLVTDENGYAITNGLPLGDYDVYETIAPVGYVLDPTVHRVSIKYKDQVTPVITNTLNLVDQVVKGKVQVVKTTDDGKTFLNNVPFGIFRASDDVMISTITTGSLTPGQTISEDLRYGDYYTKELSAPDGFYLDETKYYFSIDVNNEIEHRAITNERVEAKISVNKKESLSNEPLEHVGFSIANMDMKIIEFDIQEGKKVIKQSIFYTDKEGNTFIDALLPAGDYYLVEVDALPGYVPIAPIKFTVSKDSKIINLPVIGKVLDLGDVENMPIQTEFIKYQLNTNLLVKGAHMALIGELDGLMYAEFTTTDEPVLINKIPAGKYILRELVAPNGHVKMEDMSIEVKAEDGIQTFEFFNDITKLEISKKTITDMSELPGAKLRLEKVEGDLIDEWISTDQPHYLEKLVPGYYRLIEEIAPFGYTVAKEIVFELKETGEVQHVEMINELNQVVIKKADAHTEEFLKNAIFNRYILKELDPTCIAPAEEVSETCPYTLKDVISYKDKEYVKEYIDQFEVNDVNDGAIFRGVLPGIYVLEEIQAPTGYVLPEEPMFIEVEHVSEVQEFIITNTKKVFGIDVFKKDSVTGERLPNATFARMSKDGEVLETAVTNAEGIAHFDVEMGEYYFKEIEAPGGYQLSDQVIAVIIKGDEDENQVIEFEYFNTPLPAIKLPETGLSSDPMFAASSMISLGAILVIKYYKKSREQA